MSNIFLFGAGAFGRETKLILLELKEKYEFGGFVDVISDKEKNILFEDIFLSNCTLNSDGNIEACFHSIMNCQCIKQPAVFALTMANPQIRERTFQKIISSLNLNPRFCYRYFPNLIHHSSRVSGLHYRNAGTVCLGFGTIIYANCVLTDNIVLGNFTQLHMFTSCGHDLKAKSYLTTAPGVHIGGWNTIGERVYFGANSGTKEKISICDDVLLGGGSFLINSLEESGIYAGVPSRKIK